PHQPHQPHQPDQSDQPDQPDQSYQPHQPYPPYQPERRSHVRVLVTGATGFTGGHLASTLARRGDDVRALVRPGSLEKFHRSPLAALGITAHSGDLTDAPAVARATQGVEVVYHVAATYREAGQREQAYRAVNVQGTRNVLDAAARAGARRVVHCSTGGVHGHVANPPADEDAPFNPGDVYQDTKLEAEQLAADYRRSGAIEVVIARPIGIYGPGDTRFLKLFRGLARGRFPMLGSGEVFYHLSYIDDLVDGFRLCGEVPAAAGGTYLLAGPRYTTLNELVNLIAKELNVNPPRVHWPVWPFWTAGLVCEAVCIPLGIEPPLYRRRVDFYTKSRAFETTRARTELGYAPQIDLEEGIRRTANWYREQKLL
ncbi:MAG TPA: NAD-dependent epimerase/dehydratase family protein, partial [Vicinamibacterales bacterium]|nr:NAD-dependent epimerase/dehydratase family protein [Vicinamibacterales bacterium]